MIRRFVSYYKPYKGLFALDMICAFFIAMTDLVFPMVTRFTLNELLPSNAYYAFFSIMLALALAYILRTLMQYFVTHWGHVLGARMETDMRKDLFCHLQTLSFSFYDKNRTGQLMSRMTSDLFEIVELAHHGPEDLFLSFITLIGAVVLLFSIQWQLALVMLILIPLVVAFCIWRRKKVRAASAAVKERTGLINNDIESSISGARVSQAFDNQNYEIEKFCRGNNNYRTAKNEFYRQMGIFHSGMEFLMCLFQVIVLTIGGYIIMTYPDSLTAIDLMTFSLYIATFMQPIRKLVNFAEQYTVGMAGFRRFVALMETPSDIVEKEDAKPLDHVVGSVRYSDVSFSYDDSKGVLSGIDLDIPAGSTIALVGPSGGGKTTLCSLLPRFYDVNGGTITIDGTDITDVTLSSLRRNVGIVQQDVMLFADSLRENIRYGKLDATDEEVEQAARLAELHDDIMAMPDGYDTYIGERGMRLSGGQKQRVSIARNILKNPPILILDEATSALDTITEAHIQRSFEKLCVGRTTLIIAHRLSTVRHADQIIYLDTNGIRERGTHEELMEKDGAYAALYHIMEQD